MSNSSIIDLTNSFTLVDHCCLTNTVIDLDTDDSFSMEISCPTDLAPINHEMTQAKSMKPTSNTAADIANKKKIKQKHNNLWRLSKKSEADNKNKFGDCPICWDELGKNPLASTKCGHVYCIKCIQEYLKVQKKCPTCRHSLKGASAYHPLYLNRE